MKYREEKDSIGTVKVASDRYWGAQTQRSLENFPVGEEKMPKEIIYAFALLKKASAEANCSLCERMTEEKRDIISEVCDEILSGKLDGHFPLAVWQTGSGTQTNMNVNEVIANRGNEIAGKKLLHPNDDVNMSQSSNDTFPSAMNIAFALALKEKLIPAAEKLLSSFAKLEKENEGIIKCGRTHLQDAVPISFPQEISGWRGAAENDLDAVKEALKGLYPLAIGGSAVGTGLNVPEGFGKMCAEKLKEYTSLPFVSSENKFRSLSSLGAAANAHGTLKALAADLMKISNDIKWLASGPRCGLGEITIAANEPGSSIMPGKVNPTQCEMMNMVAAKVMGNDVTTGIAASSGNFELNVFLPVTAYCFLQSVKLLSDGMSSFAERCVSTIKADRERMEHYLDVTLMKVTALSPSIGYDKAAEAAKKAQKENITLKEACVSLGYVSEEEFDRICDGKKMI